MLEIAKKELEQVSKEEKIVAEQKIALLEQQLAEAETKGQRAKSMAEQTRRGFGEDVYKIGLTRRLEPLDRVTELGGASAPFTFDVHAMIYSDAPPALERLLRREFSHCRVNAVNLRKEFFKTDIQSIKSVAEKLTEGYIEFKMTVLADEYYESRRLQSKVS